MKTVVTTTVDADPALGISLLHNQSELNGISIMDDCH